jgi:hypothetical protein
MPCLNLHLDANTECHALSAFLPLMSPIQSALHVCSQTCPLGFSKIPDDWRPLCCYDCAPCPDGEFANETGIYKMILNVEISRNTSQC